MADKRNLAFDLSALVLLAVVAFLVLALASYAPSDPPSTLVHPPGEVPVNVCGRLGAKAANGLLQLFGVGAYYLIFSLAVLDVRLLMRRSIDQPLLRTWGWCMTLAGITTLLSLLLPQWTPGPMIGPGGYLGATGLATLQADFATTGTFLIALSVVLAGLLLTTDYFVIHLLASSIGWAGNSAAEFGRNVSQARRRAAATAALGTAAVEGDSNEETAAEDEEYDEEYEEEEYEDGEYEEEEEATEPAIRIRGQDRDEADESAEEEEEEYEEEEEAEEPAAEESAQPDQSAAASTKLGMRRRVASALGLRNAAKPQASPRAAAQADRQQVIEELEAASQVDDSREYELPSKDLLLPGVHELCDEHEKEVRHKAKLLEKTFASFGFNVKVVEIETGPVIAQYEVALEQGLRLNKITSLTDDLAIALRVPSVRIVAPIPGKNTVGIEVPNEHRQLVRLRDVMDELSGRTDRMNIPVFLGKDVSGQPMCVDLATMPHLLIAGRTGTGKSVCLNSIIISMLMTRRPDEVRMLMVDPKMVELSPYKSLPHLMHPVVTDMRKAEAIMSWAVDKMEERYSLLARAGVRNITSYNQLGEEELLDRLKPETDEERDQIPKHLPFIVVVADEIADLMLTAGKDVEQHIIRLAQKSRAVGIHLILATQKPTVDVITGLIKSNLPARIAFQVASRTDSRVVLDEMGAERLLGNGDMLFLQPGTSQLIRGQGTYLSDDEITRVIAAVETSEPQFVQELVQLKTESSEETGNGQFQRRDDLYESAVDIIVRERRGSVSLLQRALGIGYGRGARLIDFMAEDGIVGPYNGSQAREVLISLEDWEAMSNGSDDPDPEPPKPKRSRQLRTDDSSSSSPSRSAATPPWQEAETAASVTTVTAEQEEVSPDPLRVHEQEVATREDVALEEESGEPDAQPPRLAYSQLDEDAETPELEVQTPPTCDEDSDDERECASTEGDGVAAEIEPEGDEEEYEYEYVYEEVDVDEEEDPTAVEGDGEEEEYEEYEYEYEEDEGDIAAEEDDGETDVDEDEEYDSAEEYDEDEEEEYEYEEGQDDAA